MIEIEKASISEQELIARWKMHSATFFFRKLNNQIPKRFLKNMTSRYYLDDVEVYEAANGVTVVIIPTGDS